MSTPTTSGEGHGSITSYAIGFAVSLTLTLIPYYLVSSGAVRGTALAATLIIFALLQLMVQLYFFLHLGAETRPRWKLIAFLFAGMVVGIVVLGSLWIMYNLDYNMMHGHDVEQHIMDEEGIYR